MEGSRGPLRVAQAQQWRLSRCGGISSPDLGEESSKGPGAHRGSLGAAGGGLGPGLGPGGRQLSIFSAFQVSHEFAINFNPTNPFCSGERQASPHLPWVCAGPPSWAEGGRSTGLQASVLSSSPFPLRFSQHEQDGSWSCRLESGGPGFKSSCCPFLAV